MKVRELRELVNDREPGLPWVMEQLEESAVDVVMLPCKREDGERALLKVQVTTKSPMGAIVYGCAGILVDHGWLRFLGAGCHPRMQRSLPSWNQGRSGRFVMFADDALGGLFAINGGHFDGPVGDVHYFAPDTLEWEGLELGYSQFLCWSLQKDSLAEFYEGSRWEGWEAESASLSGDESINVYPFQFTEGPPIGERSRRVVPVSETIELLWYLRDQIGSGGKDA